MKKVVSILEPVSLLLVPVVLVICAIFEVEQTALISLVVVTAALVPFFIQLERSKLRARDIMPVVIMAALAAVGRIIFAPLPSVKPVYAIVIMSGICFGRQSGFLVGALAALVSNMFFGQGPWTPWQMYSWGLIGYVAGVLFSAKIGAEAGGRKLDRNWIICVYGFVSSVLAGLILDSYYVVGFVSPLTWKSVLVGYGMGLPFSITLGLSTAFFLALAILPWRKSVSRIQKKYGLLETEKSTLRDS